MMPFYLKLLYGHNSGYCHPAVHSALLLLSLLIWSAASTPATPPRYTPVTSTQTASCEMCGLDSICEGICVQVN